MRRYNKFLARFRSLKHQIRFQNMYEKSNEMHQQQHIVQQQQHIIIAAVEY